MTLQARVSLPLALAVAGAGLLLSFSGGVGAADGAACESSQGSCTVDSVTEPTGSEGLRAELTVAGVDPRTPTRVTLTPSSGEERSYELPPIDETQADCSIKHECGLFQPPVSCSAKGTDTHCESMGSFGGGAVACSVLNPKTQTWNTDIRECGK